MKTRFLHAVFFMAILLFYLSPSSWAAGLFDPNLKWRTIETDHFCVHYHKGMENTAMEVAREAERIHRELTIRLNHVPRAKVHLIVADTSDFPNGITRTFPYPQVLLFPTTPPADSGLDNYDAWIRTLLAHELTHVVAIDMTRGVPAALRYVFGYTIAMNALVPDWLTEGGAVYEETALTTGGRGRSAYMDMVLRSAVLERNFPSIDRAGEGMIQWPGGQTPYLFGGAFYAYLVEQYGAETLTEFLHLYSGRLIPFRINSAAKKVFGKDFTTLWKEWENSLVEKYRAQQSGIISRGITAGNAITDRGYGIGMPLWSGDSSRIIFHEYSPHKGDSVRTISPEGVEEKKLLKAGPVGQMSLDPTGERLAYATVIPFKGTKGRRFYTYTDIYIYDLKSRKSSRLTNGERARDPDWSPDGERVVYVSRTKSGTALKSIETQTGQIAQLVKPEEGVTIDSPRFSPDGLNIAFSARVAGAGRDIFILRSGESKPRRLTTHPARDLHPAWSADGRYVLFTSERTGVPNIFAVDASSRDLFQVTNVLGGAFEPAVGNDGRMIAYSGYSSRGYDLWVLPFDESSWRPIHEESVFETFPDPEIVPEVAVVNKPYRPWRGLLPRYLLPTFWYDGVDFSAGLLTGSISPLGRHAWLAETKWGSGSEYLSWGASYAYRRFIPTVGISASRYAVSYGEILLELVRAGDFWAIVIDDEDYYEERTEGRLWVEETIGLLNRPLNLRLEYNWQDRDNWTELPELTFDSTLPGRGTFSGLEFIAQYDATTTYPYSISPEKGFRTRLAVEWLDSALGSDYDQRIYTGDLRLFIPNPLLNHHVLALRAAGGIMDGDKLFQGTFRVGGSIGESIISAPGSKFFILRGYQIAQFVGDKAVVASGEYRFPLFYPQRGGAKFPIFMQKVHAAIFADYGGAFDRKSEYPLSINGVPLVDANTGQQLVLRFEEEEDWNLGAGAELRLTGFLGYGMLDSPVTGRLGYANDITGGGLGHTIYLELGTSF